MKFVVDELPYYEELCPFWTMCHDNVSDNKCPRYWSKYKICSDDNPHECCLLIEAGSIASMKSKQENNHSDNRRCKTCQHCGDLNVISTCATCYKSSNWEAKK